MRTLKYQFLDYLLTSRTETFRTRDALDWYEANKRNPSSRAYYANINNLILLPLISEGLIEKVGIGLYSVLRKLSPTPSSTISSKDEGEENLDEFEEYIKSKLGGSKHGRSTHCD
jgi:hypothetical protein